MARPLDDLLVSDPDPATTEYDLRLTRRTSRSFAAAVSVLLLATVVVDRSGSALVGATPDVTTTVSEETVDIGLDG